MTPMRSERDVEKIHECAESHRKKSFSNTFVSTTFQIQFLSLLHLHIHFALHLMPKPLKGHSTDFTYEDQFIHLKRFYLVCESSCIMSFVALEESSKVLQKDPDDVIMVILDSASIL